MTHLRAIAMCVVLAACAKADPRPDPIPAPEEIVGLRDYAVMRLLKDFVNPYGFIVSRPRGWRDLPDGALDSKGNPANEDRRGEGLIWAGVALASLPCADGDWIEQKMVGHILGESGALIRIWPLGEYEYGREVTLDGALGLYLGVAHRITKCGKADVWRDAMEAHKDYREESQGGLHPNSDARLDLGFDYPLELALHKLGLRSHPHRDVLHLLETTVSSWAWGVKRARAACYRVNLGLIALETVEALGGKISDRGRNAFCAATDGMDIPTVDHWCGRGDLAGWVHAFDFDVWEMRHQRCGAWETPDANGLETPGLDLLRAIALAYDVPKSEDER